jgi:heme-degrading monooxygenase HmoA
MFARVTWSKLVTPQPQIDVAVSNFRARILPSLQTQAGFLGAVVLANAETGEGASTTYWQTAEALAASEEMATAGRAEAAQASGLQINEIDRFEMILQDRAAPVKAGTFVRVNDVQASTAQIDATVSFMRDTVIPTMKSLSGYRALLIFANRQSGRMLVASAWDTAADREASDASISGLRRQAVDVAQAQGGAVRITLYESVLAEVSAAAQQMTTAKAAIA